MFGKPKPATTASTPTALPVEDDAAARRSRQRYLTTMRGANREGSLLSGRGGDTSQAPTRSGAEGSATVLG